MKLKKMSPISGTYNIMEIDVTASQIIEWENGDEHVQVAFPHLNPSEREFLQTGITAEEWDAMFQDDDDDFEQGTQTMQ